MTDEQARKLAAISVVVIPKRIMGGLTMGVNRRYRSGALRGDEESESLKVKVTRRGSVRVERVVRHVGRNQDNGIPETCLSSWARFGSIIMTWFWPVRSSRRKRMSFRFRIVLISQVGIVLFFRIARNILNPVF